jgi:hypothetical protein
MIGASFSVGDGRRQRYLISSMDLRFGDGRSLGRLESSTCSLEKGVLAPAPPALCVSVIEEDDGADQDDGGADNEPADAKQISPERANAQRRRVGGATDATDIASTVGMVTLHESERFGGIRVVSPANRATAFPRSSFSSAALDLGFAQRGQSLQPISPISEDFQP